MRFVVENNDSEQLIPIDELWDNLPKLSLEDVRRDIPMLSKYIYLDSAATSLTPNPILEEMMKYYLAYNTNIERAGYAIAEYATNVHHKAHSKVAELLLNCSSQELILTRNTTEGMNMVANHFMANETLKGKNIIISDIEHHSNMLPWIRLVNRNNMELKILETSNDRINPDQLEAMIDKNTILVALQHGSNVTGIEQDVCSLSEVCRHKGVLIAIDGAQIAGHQKVDVKKIGCDFYSFSGHKGVMGPTGTGGLYVRKELLEERAVDCKEFLQKQGTLGIHKFNSPHEYVKTLFEPMLIGGGCIADVNYDNYVLTEAPSRYRAGTPNIAGEIGLGRAAVYVAEQIGFDSIVKREKKLTEKILDGLLNIDAVQVYGPDHVTYKSGVVSFNIRGKSSYECAMILDRHKICVRSGPHCVMPWHKKQNLMENIGSVRASIHYYNTEEEISEFLDAVKDIVVK